MNKPITLWSRWVKTNDEYQWVFNHIEDGHVTAELPTFKMPEHKRVWQGKWMFEHAWLTNQLPGVVTRTQQ